MKAILQWRAVVFAGFILRIPVLARFYPAYVVESGVWRIAGNRMIIGSKHSSGSVRH